MAMVFHTSGGIISIVLSSSKHLQHIKFCIDVFIKMFGLHDKFLQKQSDIHSQSAIILKG